MSEEGERRTSPKSLSAAVNFISAACLRLAAFHLMKAKAEELGLTRAPERHHIQNVGCSKKKRCGPSSILLDVRRTQLVNVRCLLNMCCRLSSRRSTEDLQRPAGGSEELMTCFRSSAAPQYPATARLINAGVRFQPGKSNNTNPTPSSIKPPTCSRVMGMSVETLRFMSREEF
ncbi:uncharacterized protein V6R79_018337 [Siganus canaliculatus]